LSGAEIACTCLKSPEGMGTWNQSAGFTLRASGGSMSATGAGTTGGGSDDARESGRPARAAVSDGSATSSAPVLRTLRRKKLMTKLALTRPFQTTPNYSRLLKIWSKVLAQHHCCDL
jgi:hypothetical protein